MKTTDKSTTTAQNDANERTKRNKKRVPTINARNDLYHENGRYHTDYGSNHANQNPNWVPKTPAALIDAAEPDHKTIITIAVSTNQITENAHHQTSNEYPVSYTHLTLPTILLV